MWTIPFAAGTALADEPVETEFPTPDYRFIEGPTGGVLNGPFE